MSKSQNGVSISFILFLVFLILKLTNQIDWNWIWIFSPFWVPISIVIVVFIIVFFIGLIYMANTGKNIENFLKKIKTF
jgi:uncharacterized integral membrane protein